MRAADDDTPTLPNDAAALPALLLETRALVNTLVAERDALASQNERLQHLLLKLKRRQFGQKSGRLPEEQLLFAFEEIKATLAENAAAAGKASPALRDNQARRRRARRGRLPAHLPHVEIVLAPEATACPCCRGPLVEIGVDTAERLDVIPAQFRVIVTKRPKLACRVCTGVVVQAPAPARLIADGVLTEATVAHVLVPRYADHLPLYRQAQILARQRIEIGREVLADWTSTAAKKIMPVVRRMREILLGSPRLFDWFSAQMARLPGSSPTAEAIRYVLNHRERLAQFLDDGRIEIDTNTVERAIRPICLSGKNAPFASGDDGRARWAAAESLVETCELNGVDTQRYVTEVLTRLVNGWPNGRIDELMPWCWNVRGRT